MKDASYEEYFARVRAEFDAEWKKFFDSLTLPQWHAWWTVHLVTVALGASARMDEVLYASDANRCFPIAAKVLGRRGRLYGIRKRDGYCEAILIYHQVYPNGPLTRKHYSTPWQDHFGDKKYLEAHPDRESIVKAARAFREALVGKPNGAK